MAAEPTVTFTPKSHMDRATMVHLVESGQTVLVPARVSIDAQGNRLYPPGRIVSRVEDLPTEADLAQEDPQAQEALARRLIAQREALDRQLAQLPVPKRGDAPPAAQASDEPMVPEATARQALEDQGNHYRRQVAEREDRIRELEAQIQAPTDPGSEDQGKGGKKGK